MILSDEIVNKYIDESKMFKNRLININEEVDITRPLTPTSKNSLINEGVRSANLNLSLLNLYQYIYLHNNLLENGIKPIVKNNQLQNTNSFLNFKQEVSRIEHDLFRARLKNKYPTSNIYVTNDFQDSNSKSASLLIDPKTNISFNSLEICNGNKQTLTLNERINYKIKPKQTYIKHDECNCLIWEIDDLNYLTDEKKNFRCIVRKKRNNVFSNVEIENSAALLTIVFDFKTIRKINSLRINENCISKMILEKDDIRYWEKGRYKSITSSSEYIDGELVFFNTIETSRIKITFKQLSFLDINQDYDTNALPVSLYSVDKSKDDSFYYYDMSLSEIEFNYSIYKPQSLYRSNYIYGFKKPQSISFEETYTFYDNISFVEKYLYLILYGDKESTFLNEKGVSIRDFSRSKPTFEGLLPITSEYKYKELALPSFFNGRDAYCKLTFVPILDSIRLNSNEQIAVFTQDMSDVSEITNYEAGSYFIKIANYSYSNEYVLEYDINTNDKMTILNDFVFENGSIIVPEKYSNSIGFIQPIIVLRNKSIYNDSTCVIKSYGLIVEEKESLENNVLNYDIFLAENRGL